MSVPRGGVSGGLPLRMGSCLGPGGMVWWVPGRPGSLQPGGSFRRHVTRCCWLRSVNRSSRDACCVPAGVAGSGDPGPFAQIHYCPRRTQSDWRLEQETDKIKAEKGEMYREAVSVD